MLFSVRDEKDDVVAVVFTKEEAAKIMIGHPKWVLREVPRIWP